MKAVVIYESLTGNTRYVAERVADGLAEAGVGVTVCPAVEVDLQALSEADLVYVGSWTDGIFVVGQRPGRAGRIKNLPAMRGKRVVAYCTYALNPGGTVGKIASMVRWLGGDVVGEVAVHRKRMDDGARDLVDLGLGRVRAAAS
ncbi:MAG: flavodoxin family protein [Acidimicrobiales bacterium]|jgi:hypothetical protein